MKAERETQWEIFLMLLIFTFYKGRLQMIPVVYCSKMRVWVRTTNVPLGHISKHYPFLERHSLSRVYCPVHCRISLLGYDFHRIFEQTCSIDLYMWSHQTWYSDCGMSSFELSVKSILSHAKLFVLPFPPPFSSHSAVVFLVWSPRTKLFFFFCESNCAFNHLQYFSVS